MLGSGTQLRLNPRMQEGDRRKFEKMLVEANPPDGLIWITSSGSSGFPKLVGLSRKALESSATAVNEHLSSNAKDAWLLALPTFHVGGMGIEARAQLSGARVVPLAEAWSAEVFHGLAEREGITLSALVPAQLYDLVRYGKQAPSTIRGIVLGGDALLPDLYKKARELGYPVLPSYGLSECCSQVATAGLDSIASPAMPLPKILGHVECALGKGQALRIRSAALFEGYVIAKENGACFVDPKVDGWFETSDRVRIIGGVLEVLGRSSNIVKVSGEQVDLGRLSKIFASRMIGKDAIVFAVPDERTGQSIVAVASREAAGAALEAACEQFNSEVMPFERIRWIRIVERIPRTALGKVAEEEVRRLLEDSELERI